MLASTDVSRSVGAHLAYSRGQVYARVSMALDLVHS
jgi:hypothetical protein